MPLGGRSRLQHRESTRSDELPTARLAVASLCPHPCTLFLFHSFRAQPDFAVAAPPRMLFRGPEIGHKVLAVTVSSRIH